VTIPAATSSDTMMKLMVGAFNNFVFPETGRNSFKGVIKLSMQNYNAIGRQAFGFETYGSE
jgi:hypothetical protein